MILASSSKRLACQFLIRKVPHFAVTSSRKESNWSEVLDEAVPARKSYRDFQTLNGNQRDALAASLDDSKSMVTVLGSPGTGKTLLVTELVHSMCTKKQRVLVICGSRELLYSTVCRYFRRAKCSDHFVHLQPFDEKAAFRIMPNIRRHIYAHHPAAREALDKRSLVKMISRKKPTRNDITSGIAEVLESPSARHQTRIVFATPDDVFALLEHLSVRISSSSPSSSPPSPPALFDAVVLEDVAALKSAEDWRSFLPLAPLLRVFSDPHHSIALPPSADSEETPFQCSVVQQIAPNREESTVFILDQQYRSNMNAQIWSGRAFYAPLYKELDLARPVAHAQQELRLNHLMDRLVLDERTVNTDTLTLVDTGALEGHWTETMFKPYKMAAWAGDSSAPSLVNWGEALLAAMHIDSLLSYGIWPFQIACFTHSSAHGEAIRRILFSLNSSLRFTAAHSGCVEFGRVEQYLGRSFEALVKSFVSDDVFAQSFRSPRALHYLSAELVASNRQIFMIGPLRRFQQLRQKEAYEFVNLFKNRGTIITPSEFFPLQKGQFENIIREAMRDSSAEEKSKFGEQKREGNKWREQRQTKNTFHDETNDKNRRAKHHSG